MKIPQCSFCSFPAAWKRPTDGDLLCVKHFNKSFLKKVQRTINRYQLFGRDDKIVVGLSGGKDSVVLLDVLTKLQKKYPTTLHALSIDEGIRNYREDGLRFAKLAADRAGVEHTIMSYKDMFGYDLDDALILLGPDRKTACATCGPFRRKILNVGARELNADKLATGHNADDESQTFLMNIFRGDMVKSLHSNPVPKFKNKAFVNRVKPLRRTTEQEIVLYANFNNLPYQETPCPYAVEAYRGRIRDLLMEYQEHEPGVIYAILNSADSLFSMSDLIPSGVEFDGNKQIYQCNRCKEPTNSDYCGSCRIVMNIESNQIPGK